jgi:flagellar motor switch protein FliM
MSRILSQEEVKALLQQPVPTEADEGPSQVTPYDFRERGRMPVGRLRYLQMLHDRFVHQLSVSLGAFLRSVILLRLEQVMQLSSRRFLQELPDPSAVFVSRPTPHGQVALAIENELALAFVDRLLGGRGTKPTIERPATEIELSVLGSLVDILLRGLYSTWSPVVELDPEIERTETRPTLVNLDPPDENRVILDISSSFGIDGAAMGMIRISFPLGIAEILATDIARNGVEEAAPPERGPSDMRALAAVLSQVEVEMAVDLLAEGVTVGDLMQLSAGRVLNLGRPAEEPAEVVVGGMRKFQGVLALSGGAPAVEVTVSYDSE